VVAQSGAPIDNDALRIFLGRRLPNAMIPASFMELDALPLMPSGKLDRQALPAAERPSPNAHVEPVTPIGKKLAALWQQVLRVERVGLHDNFFELGGDSLNVAEVAAHFPAWFEMELPLGSLFQAPTVADLAALIERLGGEQHDTAAADLAALSEHVGGEQHDPLSVVLPLRKPGKTEQRPLFCIHPIIGVSMGFSGLLRHLDPAIPVYGLQSRGLRSGVTLPGSIEEIAADYLAQIRRIQPQGPYRLIGRSLGGLIGHSIAGQMQAQGLQVEMLAMIDSYVFMSGESARSRTEAEEVAAALRFLDIHLARENTPKTLRELSEFLLHSESASVIPQVQGTLKVAKEIAKSDPEFVHRMSAVILNNLKLARRYVARKVDVDLLYFQATEITGDLDGILDRHPSAWRPWVGRIQVHGLACHHEAVLDPVPAAQIASELQQRLFSPQGAWTMEVWAGRQEKAIGTGWA
jgi:enterobactin synthetase component F